MIALQTDELKEFTRQLFIGSTFDHFLVREAQIVTFNNFQIDGHIRPGYYSKDEMEMQNMETFSAWSTLRPFCFSLIKGKRLPESFYIVMQLSGKEKEAFLDGRGIGFSANEVSGLYLNIRYEDKLITCITGTSVTRFTMDKSLEREWDQAVKEFFKEKGIPLQEV